MQQSAVRNQQEDHQIAKRSIHEDNTKCKNARGQIQPLSTDITTKSLTNQSSSQVGREMRIYAVLQEKCMR
jgi:hypothetical protein